MKNDSLRHAQRLMDEVAGIRPIVRPLQYIQVVPNPVVAVRIRSGLGLVVRVISGPGYNSSGELTISDYPAAAGNLAPALRQIAEDYGGVEAGVERSPCPTCGASRRIEMERVKEGRA